MTDRDILYVTGKDYCNMTIRLLEKADLASIIGDRDARIALKPNLITASKASYGATTHPEIVDGVLTYLENKGFTNVFLMEGSWLGDDTDRAFRVNGVGDVCRKHGIEYYNTKKDKYVTIQGGGQSFKVTDRIVGLDWLINLPVLKGHCQTLMTCALKNHKGIISDPEKRRFHSEGLHRPIAGLVKAVTQKVHEFVVVDNICGDLDFEEGGNPVVNNRILCCKDPVLCDSYVLKFLGYDLDDVQYVKMAYEMGVGNADLSDMNLIDADGSDAKVSSSAQPTNRAQVLAKYTDAQDACSSCYANLIAALDRLDNEGLLAGSNLKVCIGQKFRGKGFEGVGVGNCTRGLTHTVKGCPPSADEMYEFLKTQV